jgi:hypothetical protein
MQENGRKGDACVDQVPAVFAAERILSLRQIATSCTKHWSQLNFYIEKDDSKATILDRPSSIAPSVRACRLADIEMTDMIQHLRIDPVVCSSSGNIILDRIECH